jgi:hypothetical protein
MATPKQQVDSFLGIGWYDEWNRMDKQTEGEATRYNASRRILNLSLDSPLLDRIYNDLVLLDKIASDYARSMNLVVQGQRPSKDRLMNVHDLYTLALGVVETENTILEGLFATGFATAWAVFPFAVLQTKSKILLKVLGELRKELKEAEHEVANARNKRAVHLAVAFFEGMFPQISLTARVVIFLGDVVVDHALGPETPTKTQKYVGIAAPGIKQFSEAVHNIKGYSKQAHSIAAKTGKIASSTTFFFDTKEIWEGSDRVEKLEKLIKSVKSAYDEVVQVIEENNRGLKLFLALYEKWMVRINDYRVMAVSTRKALFEDIARYRYTP